MDPTQQKNKRAGEQFDGTEFAAATVPTIITQILLRMGTEPKDWRICLFFAESPNTPMTIVSSSTTGSSRTAASISLLEMNLRLGTGDRIAIFTIGARSHMAAKLWQEPVA